MLLVHPSERTTHTTAGVPPEGLGCRNSCLIHLTILGLLGVAMLIWAVRHRAWELEVTVELPEKAATPAAVDADPHDTTEEP